MPQKVFSVRELLESILLELPLRDLLLARNISWTYKGLIESSIHLQRRLFLKPQVAGSGDDSSASLNPFLIRVLNFHGLYRARMSIAKDGESEEPIHEFEGDSDDERLTQPHEIQARNSFVFGLPIEPAFKQDSSARSYDDMLIANPPVKLFFQAVWDYGGVDDQEYITGTTVRELVDSLVKCRTDMSEDRRIRLRIRRLFSRKPPGPTKPAGFSWKY